MAHRGMIFGGRSSEDQEGDHPIAALAMIIVAPLAAMLVQMAISRRGDFIPSGSMGILGFVALVLDCSLPAKESS
jgi:hypothetical protein